MRSLFVSLLFFLIPFVLISQDNAKTIMEDQIDSLIQRNRQLIGKGQLDASWQTIVQAKLLADSLMEPHHPVVGLCLFNYGRTLHYKQEYLQAEKSYLLALQIQRQHANTQAEDLAGTLNALAALYTTMARYEDARPLYVEALKIRQATLGESHADYAMSVNNLGSLHLAEGHLKDAERYFVHALELQKEILGEEHLDYATSVNNLGVLYKKMGKYEDAEKHFIKARNIRMKVMGPNHPLIGVSLNNLANLYLELKRFEEAETMYEEALGIWREALGSDHLYVANAYNNLAQFYQKTGNYKEAETHLHKAIAIWNEKYGGEHPQFAMGAHNLGLLFMESGNYPAAMGEMENAKEIRERVLGREHPDYGNSQNGLGQLFWHLGDATKAKEPLTEAALLQQKMLENAVKHLSEREQVEYAERFLENLDLFYSFVHDFHSSVPELTRTCVDLALFHKGFVLEASQVFRKQIRETAPVKTAFNELVLLRQKLAKEYSKPIAERSDTESLENEANDLEKEIRSSLGNQGTEQSNVTCSDIQKNLKPGTGAIEFIDFQYYHPDLTDSIFYAALVIRPDRAEPVFIPLFEKSALSLVLNPDAERRSDYVNGLYAYADRGFRAENEPEQSLYDLIWKPLQEHPDGVGDLKTLYFSLSGLLHRINLGAIPIDSERNLADQFHLVQLGSTRKLTEEHRTQAVVKNGVLFGGIRYDLDSLEILAALELDDPSLLASRGEQSISGIDQSLRAQGWNYLKWTERESSSIATTLEESNISIEQYSDIDGTEEAFKSMGTGGQSSPGILHMATHGYFFPDPAEIQNESNQEVIFQLSANPMIRSGLILAGGNYVWSGHQPFSGREDGILTAYEISQMDLSHTELVVLSACETGLGDINGNEGVFGLQRAFKIAGAKNLIMSLWQVPDRETMQFMTTFYQHWLKEEMTIPEAFQMTQREMRDRFFNPYSWAGFVLIE